MRLAWRWWSLAAGLLAAALAATGCRPGPLRFGPEGRIDDPAVLLRLIEAREAHIQSLKGEARVRVHTPQQSGTLSQFVAAQAPSRLHLESLNFFGKPVAVLASNAERFSLFSEEQGTFYSGPPTGANLSLLLPVELAPDEVVALVLSAIPRIAATRSRVEIDDQARAYRLVLERGAVVQRIWVGTEDYRPLRSEIRGAPAYDLAFGNFQLIDGVVFPTETELTAVDAAGKARGTSLKLGYKDVELNRPLDPDLFTLAAPPNARRVELDAAGRPVSPEEERGSPGADRPDASGPPPR